MIIYCLLRVFLLRGFVYIYAFFVHFFKYDLYTVHLRDLGTPGLLLLNDAIISSLSNNSFLSNTFAPWPMQNLL
jgi:hypothetical protein